MKADKWKRDKLRGTYTREGYTLYKTGRPKSLNKGWYVEGPNGEFIASPDYLEEAKRIGDEAIAASKTRKENPIMKKPTPAQLAARAKFAEMARSGAFKKKAKRNPAKKTVSEKISQLVREGYPQKQAVAVALSEQRAGKVKSNPRPGGAPARGRKPSIEVGDYVRSYDFPGMRDDFYLEGVVTKIGNGVYSIAVSRRIVEGEEKPVTVSLRQVQAPIEPNFFTGAYGVQKLTRKTNPATGRKGSGTKLNPMKYRDIAKGTPETRVQYAVHLADRPSYHAMAYFTKKADALAVAKEVADRTGKTIAVSRVQVHFGPL